MERPTEPPQLILLDTNVLITPPRFSPNERYGASMIALAELQFGIQSSPDASSRSERVLKLMQYREGIEWLPFDERAAESYGILATVVSQSRAAHARSKDILMVSQAHALGVPFLTRNPRDFTLVSHLVEIREVT